MKQNTNLGVDLQTGLGEEQNLKMDENVVVEFAKGITSEQMEAMFFNNVELREPNYRLYQLNSRGKRYYYTFEGDEPVFYPSVTTMLSAVMPENKILTEWKLSLGKEKAEAYTMERANYGSFVHGQLARMMIAGKYNLDLVREELGKYCERNGLPDSFVDLHEEEAKADLVAFAKWMYDYDVKPLAVEISLRSELGYAGTIDLPCNMRLYSREDKKHSDDNTRINAICDYKTGKKGFHDDNAIQLELYRMMWNENFDMNIDRIFNVAPKDWRGTVKKIPSYNFVEQTDNPVLNRIPAYLELFRLMDDEDRKITICSGEIDLSSGENKNVEVLTLSEMIKSHKQEDVAEEEEISDSLFD